MQMELPGLDPGPLQKTAPGAGDSPPDTQTLPGRGRRSKSSQLVLPGTVLRLASQTAAKDNRIARKRVA